MITLKFRLFILVMSLVVLVGCGGSPVSDNGAYTASGLIEDVDGDPVANVVLAFGNFGTSTTDRYGEWEKSGLRGEVTVVPAKQGFEFNPPEQIVTPTYARQVMFVGELKTISVSPESATVAVDDEIVFTATGRDKYGQPTPTNANWIVTGGIGTASPSQGDETTFTATTPGEGSVVAEVDDDIVTYALVTVVPRREEYEFDVTHDIDVIPVNKVGGTVNATVDVDSYTYGIIVTLEAVPSPGWSFIGWEGEYESNDSTIDAVVINRQREPVDPFSGGSQIIWDWPHYPGTTHHPEIVAFGETIEVPKSRTDIGDELEAKFASRPITAIFEKNY